MTRDEAVKTLCDVVFPDEQLEGSNRRKAGALVDAWSKLGMLKLEEPEKPEARIARKVMHAISYSLRRDATIVELAAFDAAFKTAGLKIIEV